MLLFSKARQLYHVRFEIFAYNVRRKKQFATYQVDGESSQYFLHLLIPRRRCFRSTDNIWNTASEVQDPELNKNVLYTIYYLQLPKLELLL